MTTIVECGGNSASVARALERLGEPTHLVSNPAQMTTSERLILPGVGHFAALMRRLGADGAAAVRTRAAAGIPVLGICLGLQALGEGSEEAPDVVGLGLLTGRAQRLTPPAPWRVPHVGWSPVASHGGEPAHFYFTHSYFVPPGSDTRATAWAGVEIAAVCTRGNVCGVQFHPEKSGEAGLQWLQRWLCTPRVSPPRRILACLDVQIRNGETRVVKGVQFDNLRDCGDPAVLAARHARSGADEVWVLDIGATLAERGPLTSCVRRIARELDVPLGAGGGVRSLADAAALVAAGADKISVNSAAVERPALIEELARELGSQAVVVAIDVRGGRVRTRAGGTDGGRDVIAWAREAAARGAGEILLTSMERDGRRRGFDCELTATAAAAVEIPVIASGGGGSAADFVEVLTHGGADAALAAGIFHDGRCTAADLKRDLAAAGIEVRS